MARVRTRKGMAVFGGRAVKKVPPPSRRLSRGRPALDWRQDAPRTAGKMPAVQNRCLFTRGNRCARREPPLVADNGVRLPKAPREFLPPKCSRTVA
jgi:hypothetical protein